jgi:hypothetical protein
MVPNEGSDIDAEKIGQEVQIPENKYHTPGLVKAVDGSTIVVEALSKSDAGEAATSTEYTIVVTPETVVAALTLKYSEEEIRAKREEFQAQIMDFLKQNGSAEPPTEPEFYVRKTVGVAEVGVGDSVTIITDTELNTTGSVVAEFIELVSTGE